MIKYFKKDFEETIIKNLNIVNTEVLFEGDNFAYICGSYNCDECWLNDSENCYNDVQQLVKSVTRKEKLKKLLKE